MVLLFAFIRRAAVPAVHRRLRAHGVAGWSESTVVGHGRRAGGHEVEHVRLEVLLPKSQLAEVKRALAGDCPTDDAEGGLFVVLPVAETGRVPDHS